MPQESKTTARKRSGGQPTRPGKSTISTVPMGGNPNQFTSDKRTGSSKSTKKGQGVKKDKPWRQL